MTTRLDADDPSTDTSSSEDNVPIILLRRSIRQKRPTLSCTVCDTNDQQVESKIPAVMGPNPLDDTSDITKPNVDNPPTNESSEGDIPATLLGRRGPPRVALHSIGMGGRPKMSVEAFTLDKKRVPAYATLPLHKGCQFCAHKYRPQASSTEL